MVHRERNYNVRTAVRKSIREVSDAVKEGEKKVATGALSKAFKVIDTAAKKHVLHKSTADRRKSLLSRMIATIKD